MTTTATLPNGPVTLNAGDGPTQRARVEFAQDDLLILRMPDGELPPVGREVTLRWPAGPRGRYALAGTVAKAMPPHGGTPGRLVLTIVGEPVLEQLRRFVRGGGGEPAKLTRPGHTTVEGRLRDISEQGLRGVFPGIQTMRGERVTIQAQLETDLIRVTGTVLKLVDGRPHEIVVEFDPGEPQARVIRRYVLRQQMLARAREAGRAAETA
jgi:hypothetical protein